MNDFTEKYYRVVSHHNGNNKVELENVQYDNYDFACSSAKKIADRKGCDVSVVEVINSSRRMNVFTGEKMDTEKQKLISRFEEAISKQAPYIFVVIQTRDMGGEEIIINPYENFKAKLDYYEKAYDDNLVLKTFDGIKIIDFGWTYDLDCIV